jgi:hypothetical protein
MKLMFGPTTQQYIRVVGGNLHGAIAKASTESNMRPRHGRNFDRVRVGTKHWGLVTRIWFVTKKM